MFPVILKQCCRFFGCSKFSVWVCNTSDIHIGLSWSKIQLLWVLMIYHLYKMMFSAYKSVIVSPCACDLFVSKVMKITRYMDVHFWRSFFGTFSVCDDYILKSTTAWLLKLSVLYIHSFMQVHNTTFQIKTVFNNVLFSAGMHNPLHVHLLALSHMWLFWVWARFISICFCCSFLCIFVDSNLFEFWCLHVQVPTWFERTVPGGLELGEWSPPWGLAPETQLQVLQLLVVL